MQERTKATFIAGLAVSVPAHLFALTNVLHNYDNISQTPEGVGTGASSGRWVLQLLIELHQRFHINYNLPMLNGVVAILLLSLAACIIVNIFDIKSRLLCAVFGGIFLCFPAVTSAMFFMYVVHYYALAVLLAVSAVWITQRYKFGFIAGAVFCAVSIGIYQAYFPMAAVLFVLLLFKMLLDSKTDLKKIFCRGILYFTTLVLGFLTYLFCLKATLTGFGLALSDYQGVNQMGQINLHELPGLLWRVWRQMIGIIVQDYYGVSSLPIIRISIIILAVISALFAISVIVKRKRFDNVVGCAIFCVVFPLAANSIVIMCPNSRIYTLMVYASVFVYLAPIVVVDTMCGENEKTAGGKKAVRLYVTGRNVIAAVVIVVIAHYVWLSNGNYMAEYYNTEQTKNYLNSLLTQVRMTEGFNTTQQWAFIGKFSDPSYHNPWKDVPQFVYGGNGIMGKNLLMNYYSRESWFRHYMGFDPPMVDSETQKKLAKKKFVKKMPCYPDYGSIAIYKDIVIIKLSE